MQYMKKNIVGKLYKGFPQFNYIQRKFNTFAIPTLNQPNLNIWIAKIMETRKYKQSSL